MSDAPESLSEALLTARNPAGVFSAAAELFQAMMPPAHDTTSTHSFLSDKRGPFASGSNDVFQLDDDQDTLGENMLAMTLCAALSEPLLSQQYSDLGRVSTVSSSPTNSFSVIGPRSCCSAPALGTQLSSPLTAAGLATPSGGALPAGWSAQGSSPEGALTVTGSAELSSAGLEHMLRSSSACLPPAHRRKRRAVRTSDSMMQLDVNDLLPPTTLPQQQQQPLAQQLQQQQRQSMQLQDHSSGVLSHSAEFLDPRSKLGRKLLQQQQDALAAEALQMEQRLDMEVDCVQHELQKLRQHKQQQGLSQGQRMRSTQGSADLSDVIMRKVNLLGEDSLMHTQQQQQLAQADVWASSMEFTDLNSQQQLLPQPAWDMQHDFSGAVAGYTEPVAQELPPRKRAHNEAAPFNGLALRAMSDPLTAQRLQQKQQRQQLRLPTAAAAEQGALLQMLLQKRLHRQKQQQQQVQGVQVDQAVTLQRLQNALRRCASRNALNEGAVAGF